MYALKKMNFYWKTRYIMMNILERLKLAQENGKKTKEEKNKLIFEKKAKLEKDARESLEELFKRIETEIGEDIVKYDGDSGIKIPFLYSLFSYSGGGYVPFDIVSKLAIPEILAEAQFICVNSGLDLQIELVNPTTDMYYIATITIKKNIDDELARRYLFLVSKFKEHTKIMAVELIEDVMNKISKDKCKEIDEYYYGIMDKYYDPSILKMAEQICLKDQVFIHFENLQSKWTVRKQ